MDVLTVWLYRFAAWFVPRLPERLGYWLFARGGDIAFFLNTRARQNYEKNLRHVLGPDVPPVTFREITRRACQNLIKNYFDLFRLPHLRRDQIWAQLDQVQGLEFVDEALRAGRGLVGGSAHLGNFNLFVYLTAAQFEGRCEIVVPVERIEPPGVFEIAVRQRAAEGLELVPSDIAGRVLIKKLKQGAVLGLAIDLDPTGSGRIIDFFGAPARLPDGAAVLAVKYQVPLILAFIRRLENNHSAVVIEPPLALEHTGDLAKDTLCALEQIVARMEHWIRQYPEQWLMFRPVWESDKS